MDVDDIATAALEIDDASERDAFVREACANDPEKYQKVNSLLEALQHCDDHQFLGSGLFGGAIATGPDSSESVPLDPDKRFEIRSRHAVGGLGEVYIAWDNQLARTVALKQIRPEWADNDDAAARFRREAELTGYLEHPGIVPIYSLGNHPDGRPFYAMQLIQGETLQEVVLQHLEPPDHLPNVSERWKLRWYQQDAIRDLLNRFRDVCLTVDYAHSRNVIHRDLKPSNIMLGAYGQTLVVDWGLAKRTVDAGEPESQPDAAEWSAPPPEERQGDPQEKTPGSSVEQTQHGMTLGTPRFMSPEQARGEIDQVGKSADIYCLGATLYFILTGRAPHEGEADLESTFRKIIAGRIDVPHAIYPPIPRALSAIAMKAMRRDPDLRYASAGEMAVDLEHYLGDQPVSVYRSPPTERLFRLARRNPARAAAISVTAILLLIGAIAGVAIRDEMARRKLESERRQAIAASEIRQQALMRRNEAEAMVDAAMERAEAAIRDNRYADAAALASLAVDRMGEFKEFDRRRRVWTQKRERLRRLGEFVSLVRQGEDLDYLARDTEAAILLQSSLGKLNVFESSDWWSHLPVEDLSPTQADAVRWKVYRVLTALNSIYLKRMVIVMGGEKGGRTPSMFRLLRSFLTSEIGTAEAKATAELTRRIRTFRPSQSAIWLGSIADYRLHRGSRVEPATLNPPSNPADGLELSIASLIASVDPAYKTWFKDFGVTFVPRDENLSEEQYAVEVALETLRRSLDRAPDDYWICMTAGQAYFLKAQAAQRAQNVDEAIRYFDLAKTQYGRCIAIRPSTAFAHADRSTVGLEQALQMKQEATDWPGKQQRIDELLKQSLGDASSAVRLSPEQDWAYWHLGATAAFVGQHRLAIDSLFQAIDLGFDVAENLDGAILKLKDLRGRKRAIEYATERFESAQQVGLDDRQIAEVAALLASLEYSREQRPSARSWASKAMELDPLQTRAHQILGWCDYHSNRYDNAERHFRSVLDQDDTRIVAILGLARVLEEQSAESNAESNAEIEQLYRSAAKLAVSTRHRSTAWFGVAKQAVRAGDFDEAVRAIAQARRLDPACDVSMFADIARQQATVWLKQIRATDDKSRKQELLGKIRSLKEIADQVAELPNASVNEIIRAAESGPPALLPILDNKFELPIGRYWDLTPARDSTAANDTANNSSVRPRMSHHHGEGPDGATRYLCLQPASERSLKRDRSLPWELSQRLPVCRGYRYTVHLRAKLAGPENDLGAQPFELVVRQGSSELLRKPLSLEDRQWSETAASFALPASQAADEAKISEIVVAIVLPGRAHAGLCVDSIEGRRN
ncbi:protein kinase [Roseiconus lacunae]|nr:protein kinase [Roseiconus lacunae]